MLRSRKLTGYHTQESEEKPKHSTTINDLRDKLRVQNRLRQASKPGGGGILNAIRNLKFDSSKLNGSVKKQASRMPDIFERKVP